jgi:adenylyl-sulfate kinase
MKLTDRTTPTVWLTGLSGAGKSTLAIALKEKLSELGCSSYILDGDVLRNGINQDLGFSPDDRSENIRRVAEIAKLMNHAGLITIVALISPGKNDRKRARSIIGENAFIEVYIATPLGLCEQRDPKGLYKKARAGELKYFTGVDAPYDIPEEPTLSINTEFISVAEGVSKIIQSMRLRSE